MPLKTITFRVPEERLQALDNLAEVHQRDRSFVLNEAVNQYLSLYDYHCDLIREGIRQDEAGETVSHEEVLKMVAERARRTGPQ
jgi:predicted transcriptional regulator